MSRLLALLCAAAALLAGCAPVAPEPVTLRVLASSELADVVPLLADLRAETGIDLQLDMGDPVDAAIALTPGAYRHDMAWLSSDRYFMLRLAQSDAVATAPIRTSTMLSPVVIGVRPALAGRLRASGAVSWADIADSAAAGELRFAMGDPRRTGSGLAALVGVATAAAGTGRALRPQDVTCDRLRGLFAGQAVTADGTAALVDAYVAAQGDVTALVAHESTLLTLNDSGRLAEPLEIIYPVDGIVQSEYPLLLLDPAKRAAYDRVVDWLHSEKVQRQIMERTARRPIDPDVPRSPRLPAATGNALYFPDSQQVIDTLLANYTSRSPSHVIFVLDFSGSMRGPRIAALRTAFADLTGAGDASFARFYQGERLTVIRFGGDVLAEREWAATTPDDLAALRGFVAEEPTATSTAAWSALDRAYDVASRSDPGRPVAIVLMTDGLSNAGLTADEFIARHRSSATPTFAVAVGDADTRELARVVSATGGRVVDAGPDGLSATFKEIHGCL